MGPLRVSGVNARYFTDDSGEAILLTGSHTWENRQDQSPNGAFVWDDYLDDLAIWGHNFIKLWIWEQPKPPNGLGGAGIVNTTDWLTPEIWLRTGPGNASDGGLKFDLTQYNSDFFDRTRQRCIDAGNRGMYVSIMLFDGWSVADKGGSTDPWPYHPFKISNNINSIDGDPNTDGDGYETQNHSIQAILDLQDAYVEHLIDAINDLDNVMYEICNEPVGNAGSNAWVAHVIDKIQTYEAGKAKQHPVWYTVEWPTGDNSILLASAAEAISPNADVTMDGTKVVIPDTDHYFGIGGSADWAWKLFAGGAGGICYMDSWDNNFLDCSGSGHPIQNLRDNLGYIKAMADLANLISMVPTGSTYSSTGYCLAGGSQFICYQPSNGNFTLDLSGESGTFNIRKVRLSNGDIDTAQTTTGGASRTITQPSGWTTGWACWVYK